MVMVACACVVLAAAVVGRADSVVTTVEAEVASVAVISLDQLGGCASGEVSRTSFGVVTPGERVVLEEPCVVSFGSSNDTSQLRIYQSDGAGQAMYAYSTGSVDDDFGVDGMRVEQQPGEHVYAISTIAAPDGGSYTVGRTSWVATVWKHDANGQPDAGFAGGSMSIPTAANAGAFGAAVDSQGRLLVALEALSGNELAARILPDGSMDASFGTDGVASAPGMAAAWSISELDDGSVVVGGRAGANFGVMRFTASGQPHPQFNGGVPAAFDNPVGGTDYGYRHAVQRSGRIVVVGYSHNGSSNALSLVGVLPDGTIDSSFGTAGWVTRDAGPGSDLLVDVVVDQEDRIVAAGLANIGGALHGVVLRLLPGGEPDTSFGSDGLVTHNVAGLADAFYGVAAQADGKVVAAGFSSNALGGTWAHAVRFSDDGSLDPDFGIGGLHLQSLGDGSGSEDVSGVALVDGSVLLAGYSNSLGGNFVAFVSRLAASAIPDYDEGSSDWDSGGAFAGCLASVDAGAIASWVPGPAGQCAIPDPVSDPAPHWQGIPRLRADASAVVATTATPGVVDAIARLHFGLHVPADVDPTTYQAPITLEALAPDA